MLTEGDVLLALVRAPSLEQEVVCTRLISPQRWHDLDCHDRSRLLADEAARLPVPDWQSGESPRHSIMTIVARRGWCVLGAAESEWLFAWHYSNHPVNAFSGDLILVTEHGWTDFMTGWGGEDPRLDAQRR